MLIICWFHSYKNDHIKHPKNDSKPSNSINWIDFITNCFSDKTYYLSASALRYDYCFCRTLAAC